jgi:type II restriction enzyme
LKSQQKSFGARIAGASYQAAANAITENQSPSIVLLQYDKKSWFVTNVLMIHSKCLTEDSIIKRKGLSSRAERKGWIGYDLLLGNTLRTGRVPVVVHGKVIERDFVIRSWKAAEKLAQSIGSLTGWNRDVMWYIDQLGTSFSLEDVCAMESKWARRYPNNQNIRAKIRQQLQFLRNKGLVVFNGGGKYTRTS